MSDGSQCVCDITHGFYVNNSAPYSCVPCHTLCLRCYDNSYDTCNECIQATNPLVKALSGNLCECNDGYYFNTSTTTCLSNSLYIYIYIDCQPLCEFCSSGSACDTCYTGNISYSNNECICTAANYYFDDTTKNCKGINGIYLRMRGLYIYIYIYI